MFNVVQNVMIDPNHIERLGSDLKAILYRELQRGNKVVETYSGWTPETLFVFLEKPFQENYIVHGSEIEYVELNDPHYWKAEYRDKRNNQVLACRF